ncbi:MAG: type II toxin-antitoxin system RatA family toxin [Gammaproteobacteria bacterium]|nr:type II toxin-antitoxin system RatA family toxin [Gammaproteobacteria bacterium]
MAVINKSALVPYTPVQMFSLVDDVEAYVEFLPWCSGSTVIQRTELDVTASLEISHSGFQKAFTTRNVYGKAQQINMHLVEGPFKKLEGIWQFQPLGEEGCKIMLDLEFEFSNRLIGMSFGPLFGQMAGSLVDAFTQRAIVIYG